MKKGIFLILFVLMFAVPVFAKEKYYVDFKQNVGLPGGGYSADL